MSRGIYIVSHPDHCTDLTVIAESLADACDYAAEHNDEPERAGEYDGSERVQSGRRWVQFERLDAAEDQVLELCANGVDRPDILVRVTYGGRVEPELVLFAEVGCFDKHWCRLAPGVLCGGDE